MNFEVDSAPDRAAFMRLRVRSKRRSIDWLAVERDYRSGLFSLRDLAAMHRCDHSTIANHAGSHGWIRNRDARPSAAHQPSPTTATAGS